VLAKQAEDIGFNPQYYKKCERCRKVLQRDNNRKLPTPREEYKYTSRERSKATSQV
jgi:hypothetical protein